MKLLTYFLSASISLTTFADEITIHFIKSPKGLNWSNPQKLLLSTIRNELVKTNGVRHPIGHMAVEVKCLSLGIHYFTGMTNKNSNDFTQLVFKKKYGMGVLYHVYDGKLEDSDNLKQDLEQQYQGQRSSFFTAEVSPETCQRVHRYVTEYRQLGLGNYYSGLNARPRYQEGAGCSAYAASFGEIAGFLDPQIEEQWMQLIRVPKKFIGGPITGKRVSFFKILTAFRAKWAKENEDHILTHFYDPEKGYHWAKEQYWFARVGGDVAGFPSIPEKRGNSLGVRVDFSSIPTPQDNFWLKRP